MLQNYVTIRQNVKSAKYIALYGVVCVNAEVWLVGWLNG